MKNFVALNLRLPIELHKQLKELAEKENRSLQRQIIYILQQFIDNLEGKKGKE